jgi:hypothetical protein
VKAKLTPIERLMAGMDRCALIRGEAQWKNGYRAGRPDSEGRLYEVEMALWKRCGIEEARFRKLCAQVLRESRQRAVPRRRDAR